MKGLLAIATLINGAESVEIQSRVNPIRKVVSMLQLMQGKIEVESKKKEAIYDKFMCYCKNSDDLLASAIASAEQKIPQLEASIKGEIAEKEQLEADLKAHKSDRAAAKEAVSKANAIRKKESAEYAKTSGDLITNIAALAKAIPAIEKGAGGFLQTSAASVIRELSVTMDMSSVDREMLASFLSNKNGYAPQSGEIVGILKQMKDEMTADLAGAKSAEEAAIKSFNGLVAAKTKEINALTKSIETKTSRVGDLSVATAEAENELEDTKEDLAESQKFLADLEGNCETKKTEWAEYQRVEAQEALALAETIKVLNDDDALDLFKKTLPGGAASLLQLQVTSASQRRVAIDALRNSKDPRVDLLAVAIRGGKQGFEKIVDLINKLAATLKEEQRGDDEKQAFCEEKFDKTEDQVKVLNNNVADLDTALESNEESISALKAEIRSLTDAIKALDKEVGEYTDQRKQEHADFTATLAANQAAVDLLKFAKNRLNKFYNPKLYKAPPARELSEEDQITVNFGGKLAPTAAPGGIAGTGISFVQLHNNNDAVPPPPPAADLAYKTKSSASNGVLTMLDTIVNDVEKENQIMTLTENDSQKDYEKFMADAKSKRAQDSKALSNREGSLANAQSQLVSNKEALSNKKTELMETEKSLAALHGECDWLIKYYETRKEARTGEIESIGKAKDVLNGADYA